MLVLLLSGICFKTNIKLFCRMRVRILRSQILLNYKYFKFCCIFIRTIIYFNLLSPEHIKNCKNTSFKTYTLTNIFLRCMFPIIIMFLTPAGLELVPRVQFVYLCPQTSWPNYLWLSLKTRESHEIREALSANHRRDVTQHVALTRASSDPQFAQQSFFFSFFRSENNEWQF